MGKRLNKIKQIQEILDTFIDSTRKLYEIANQEQDKEIKKILIKHIALYGLLNINLVKFVMQIVPNSVQKDIMDAEFEKLMRQLKNGK